MNAADDVLAFGPFRLDPRQKLLLEGDRPLRIGSRALEILLALLQRPGEIISKREIFSRVWPNTVVEEGTLRVHIAALRKILGDGLIGSRYVENVSGHGYRFVAPVTHLPNESAALQSALPRASNNLPTPLVRVVGRYRVVDRLAELLPQRRLVTITGPGGGGKTTVALSVANKLAPAYTHGVCFIELASIAEPTLVSSALASALRMPIFSANALPNVLRHLKEKTMLVVLDNCEHVIEAAARLAESILLEAPNVHLLATSREPLHANGEWVHRLAPLKTPDGNRALTRGEALVFPSVQLFVECAVASADSFELQESDIPLIAEICSRLGGNPLAIEVTAARVDLFGVKGLAASLDGGLQLSIRGRRTAAPRHRTLRATLDWSHELLSPEERVILRRVAVFVGAFDLESAVIVAADQQIQAATVFDCLTRLASKSLLSVDVNGEKVLYRLLDTSRAYATEKLVAAGEFELIKRRHVQMWCTAGAAEAHAHARLGEDWHTSFGRRIDDLRAAARWCYSPDSGTSLGAKLTLNLLWSEYVLAAECERHRGWEQIIAPVQPASQAALLAGLGALLGSASNRDKTPLPGMTVAGQIGARSTPQGGALWGLWLERLINLDGRIALNISKAFQDYRGPQASVPDDDTALADRLLAVAHHYAGNQTLARYHGDRVLRRAGLGTPATAEEASQLCNARSVQSRVLWAQGFPDQALQAAHQSVIEALSCGNRYLLCGTVCAAATLCRWCGDREEANRYLAMLQEYGSAYALEYYQLWADCLRMIFLLNGDDAEAEDPLRLAGAPVPSFQYLDLFIPISSELVSAGAIERIAKGEGGWCTAEILRVTGVRLLREKEQSAAPEAEARFQAALQMARRQTALCWELRAAMSLARLWRDQGRCREAHAQLAAVYGRYTEGFTTSDLIAASQLLNDLAVRPGSADAG